VRFVLVLLPAVLAAQGHELEAHVGPWAGGSGATIYEIRRSAPDVSAFMRGVVATIAVDHELGSRRAFYGAGYEFEAFRRAAGVHPYAVAGAALGLSTDTAGDALAILWNAGGGVEWRLSWLALGAEVRYAIDDRGPNGFWHRGADRSGLGLLVGVAIGFGSRTVATVSPPATVEGDAADIVRTALGALGRPYEWGGTAANGFDCSGLVQYAYGEHGIRLPRRAREQADAGSEVTPVVEALRPGDILLFSAERGAGVTHVGLYAGEGKFIHSAGEAVKLSLLDPHDPDGAYWLARWVGARRVIP